MLAQWLHTAAACLSLPTQTAVCSTHPTCRERLLVWFHINLTPEPPSLSAGAPPAVSLAIPERGLQRKDRSGGVAAQMHYLCEQPGESNVCGGGGGCASTHLVLLHHLLRCCIIFCVVAATTQVIAAASQV